MARVMIVHIVPPEGGRPSVGHMFYGEDDAECQANLEAHAKVCEVLGPALEEDRLDIEGPEHLADDEWPEFDPPGRVIDVEPR